MLNRFIAIGVGQGDAFYLEREDFSVLVDGGRSVQGFPNQFRKVTGREGVDVIVATHNDADHTNGLIGFLQSGLQCKELWLPALWADRLEDLLRKPIKFLREVITDIKELSEEKVNQHLWTLGDTYSESLEKDLPKQEAVGKERALEINEWLASAVEEQERWAETFEPYSLGFLLRYDLDILVLFFDFPPYSVRARLLQEALNAAKRIQKLALLAWHRGIRIRWFEYSTNAPPSGGMPGRLEPINSREVVPVIRHRLSALMYLALTTSNKESLVFMTPATKDIPPILFTADSNLGFKQRIPWHDGMIITAPHHGSESNKDAYARFQREAASISSIWVRSDGRFRGRPGPSYLKLNSRKYCTICRAPGFAKQNVALLANPSSGWMPAQGVLPCRCR